MADELRIVITAKDDASATMQKIAKAADSLAKSAGDAGKDGSKGFDNLGKSADKAEASLMQLSKSGSGVIRSLNDGTSAAERFGNNLITMGSGLQSVGTALDNLGKSAIDQQRQIIALNQLYGEASQEMQDFAREIQNTTMFSDDQARQAEIYFGTLRENYDLSIDQIKQLMQVTADLASIHGVTLEDAAMRIQAAIRGEGEAAEYLGLTMNQQSIDRDNLTLSMSNQEAAQFRLNALMEQTTNVQGAANTMLQTSNGQWQQFKNQIQDAGQAAGQFVGPAGEIFTTLGSGLSTVGEAARGMTEIKSGLTGLGNILKNSSAAMSVLAVATNPVTLGIAAVGAAALAGVAVWKSYNDSLHAVESAYKTLDSAQQQFLLNGDKARAEAITTAKEALQNTIDLVNAAQKVTEIGPMFPNLDEGTFARVTESISKALSDSRVDVTEYMNWLTSELNRAANDPAHAQEILAGIVETSTNNLGQFSAALDETSASSEKATSSVNLLKDALSNLLDTAATAAKGDQSWGDRFLQSLGLDFGQSEKVKTFIDEVKANWAEGLKPPEGDDATYQEWMDYINRSVPGTAEWNRKTQEYRDWLADRKDVEAEDTSDRQEFLDAQHEYNLKQAEADQERFDQQQEAREKEKQEFEERVEQRKQFAADWLATAHELMGTDDPLSQINLAGVGDQYSQLAGDITNAGNAIDTVFRVIVGNTNAIKSQAESVHSWAEELINVRGELGRIDDLMSTDTTINPYGEALLSQGQYDAAQDAYDSIAASTAKIAVNIDAIQAAQAPFIAGFLDNQSDLLEGLRQQDEVQQRVTLGWMDQNTAMAANTIITQAAAAANGELGASGVQATEQMIAGAIAVNPFLEDMLTQIGLISVETDRMGNKTVKLNVEGAKDANNDIRELSTSIRTLTDLLDDGVINGSVDFTVNGKDQIDEAATSIDNLPDEKTVDVKVNMVYPGGADSGLAIGGGDLSKWGPGMEGPTMTMPIKGEVTEVSFAGNAAVGDGTAGPAPVVDVKGKVTEVDTSVITTAADANKIDVTAKVTDVDTSALNDLKDTQIKVTADMGDAVIGAYNLQAQLDGMQDKTLNIFADATVALAAVDNVNAAAVDDKTLNIFGDATVAFAAIDNVNGATVDDKTMAIFGDASIALAAIDNVNNAAVYDKTMTINVVTAYSTTGTPPGGNFQRHGGVPGYAMGGVLFEAGEAGAELAHFAGGGTALIPSHGLYMAPPNTYIEPANSVATKLSPGMGGPTIQVHIHGNVYGVDDLTTQIMRAVVPALVQVTEEQRRGMGV